MNRDDSFFFLYSRGCTEDLSSKKESLLKEAVSLFEERQAERQRSEKAKDDEEKAMASSLRRSAMETLAGKRKHEEGEKIRQRKPNQSLVNYIFANWCAIWSNFFFAVVHL